MKHFVLLFLTALAVKESRAATEHDRPEKSHSALRVNQELRKAMLTGYDKHVHPHQGNGPVHLDLGLSLIHLHEMDEWTNTLTMEIWLRLTWNDTRLGWDEKTYKQSVLRLPSVDVWKPDIQLFNSVGTGKLTYFKGTNVLVYPDAQMLWVPPSAVKVVCSTDLQNYPYDSHVCKLKFGSWTHDTSQIAIKLYKNKYEIDMSDYWKNKIWDISEGTAEAQRLHFDCCDEPYDVIEFSFKISRRSPYYWIVLNLPCLAVVILTLAIFWLPPQAGERITLGCFVLGMLMSIIIYLAWRLPPTPKTVPRIATFCAMGIVEAAVAIMLSVFAIAKTRSQQSGPPPPLAKVLLQGWPGKVLCLESLLPLVTNESNSLESATEHLTFSDVQSSRPGDKVTFQQPWIAFILAVDRLLFLLFLLIFIIQYMVCFF